MAFITVSWSPNSAVEFRLDRISKHTHTHSRVSALEHTLPKREKTTSPGILTVRYGVPKPFNVVSLDVSDRVNMHVWDLVCEVKVLPRDDARPRPPSGLGMPPLQRRLLGLLLLPRNRFCVGDVGHFTRSVIFGRADRLSGCDPSSYGSRDRYMREDRCE